jgi:hypothetical protein
VQAQETGAYHAVLMTGFTRERKIIIVARKDFIVVERIASEQHRFVQYNQRDSWKGNERAI